VVASAVANANGSKGRSAHQDHFPMDFTHPFYSSRLGVAVRQRPEVTWLSALKRIASGAFIHALAVLLGVLTLVGALLWLVERRRNGQSQRDPVKGIGSGIWWSAVTMTTVGYGDKAPATLAGRVIGSAWMFASIIHSPEWNRMVAAYLGTELGVVRRQRTLAVSILAHSGERRRESASRPGSAAQVRAVSGSGGSVPAAALTAVESCSPQCSEPGAARRSAETPSCQSGQAASAAISATARAKS